LDPVCGLDLIGVAELVGIEALEAGPDAEETMVKVVVSRGGAHKSAIAHVICANVRWHKFESRYLYESRPLEVR
jgi:hypothetical protein